MFPCEDSKTLSVCPYPEKRNHPSFVNISPTLVIDTSMERSSRVASTTCTPKNLIFFHKINVAKERKNSSMRLHYPRLYSYRVSVAVHFRCLLSTMEATSLPAPAK